MQAAMSMSVGSGLLAPRRQAGARRAPRTVVVRAQAAHTAVAPPAKGEIKDKNAELAINGELRVVRLRVGRCAGRAQSAVACTL